MFRLAYLLMVFGTSGCGLILDFDPPDFPDALSPLDASAIDAGMDATIIADASDTSDGSIEDAAETGRDGGLDAPDVPDAEPIPDPCSDELGLCIRYHVPDGLTLSGYESNMYWTEGGVTVESGWISETCLGGLRSVAPNTYDCLFHAIPVPPTRVIYFYPLTPAPGCDATMCPGFPDAWEYWLDGTPVSGTPGVGPVSMERRPTPHGMIMAVRFTT